MSDLLLKTESPLDGLTPPVLAWYRANARDLPWRKTSDPYRIWVSEIMLQQTRVAAVLGYYARFLDAFPAVGDLASAPEDLLLKLWATTAAPGICKRPRVLFGIQAGSRTLSRNC